MKDAATGKRSPVSRLGRPQRGLVPWFIAPDPGAPVGAVLAGRWPAHCPASA